MLTRFLNAILTRLGVLEDQPVRVNGIVTVPRQQSHKYASEGAPSAKVPNGSGGL